MNKIKIKKAFSLVEISIVILIIGILTAAIVKGGKIYQDIKLVSARAVTTSAPVSRIKGLNAWHETSLAESFKEDEIEEGNSITVWYDINPSSSFKKHLKKDGNSDTPTYKKNCIGTIPCLKFDDSSNDQYLKGDNSLDIKGNDSGTVFIVGQVGIDNNGEGNYFFYSGTNQAPNLNILRLEIGVNPSRTSGFRFQGANSLFGNPFKSEKPFISTWKWSDGSISTSYYLYIDGVKLARTASTNSSSINLANDLYLVGATPDGSSAISASFDGFISEIIVYNRELTNREQSSIEKYLSQKYAIKIN